MFLVFFVTYDQCIVLILLEIPDNLHSCLVYQFSDLVFIVQGALSVSLCRDELLLCSSSLTRLESLCFVLFLSLGISDRSALHNEAFCDCTCDNGCEVFPARVTSS